ncbi:hypothetical protein RS022_06630 [Candidatus Phytoplasma rubi]|uniref:Effector n=1 Tax=Candidatus Phytoplasma rubi TaxID=399025 RepID=A0ABY7BS72_9MOLU|nr:hypothetical protein [Candidatus Phytoplasma rubi]WAN63497.1 hypothetical protein RS022_06630 [Candidatus Phytoplasma rubi]
MNTSNFFKKHLVNIIITSLIGIAIIIVFYQGRNEIKKEKEELFSPKEEIENDDSKLSSSRPKRETEKPKFIITEARFDKIKSYVLSENNNQTLLLNDLSEIEKIEIEKIRECRKQTLGFIKRHKNTINEKNKECNNLREQLQPLYHQIETLKNQLTPLEQDKENKIKQRDKLRNIGANWENHPQNSELTQINKEISSLVGQISHLNSQIGILESKQRMYENMLSNAIILRDSLQRQYYKSEKEYQNQINSLLNSLYEITSVEGKK